MKTILRRFGMLPVVIAMAGLVGWWAASSPTPAVSHADPKHTPAPVRAVIPSQVGTSQEENLQLTPDGTLAPVPRELSTLTLQELGVAWDNAATKPELQRIAQEFATRNSAESVKMLMDALASLDDFESRAELSKNLRMVSDPATLAALLPALLGNYGRGNTILNEIADAIGRMAQPETVETLAAIHWQASTQAGQSHKVLRALAGIRNPPAKRALVRLSEKADSPALAAAAAEALKNYPKEEAAEEAK